MQQTLQLWMKHVGTKRSRRQPRPVVEKRLVPLFPHLGYDQVALGSSSNFPLQSWSSVVQSDANGPEVKRPSYKVQLKAVNLFSTSTPSLLSSCRAEQQTPRPPVAPPHPFFMAVFIHLLVLPATRHHRDHFEQLCLPWLRRPGRSGLAW